MTTGPRRPRPLLSALLLAAALAGCANLQPVRDFGKTAARLSTFPEAGDSYLASAVASEPYVRGSPASFVDRSARAAQVDAAVALQTELGRYFALLAKLAGEDTYRLDSELGTMGKGASAIADGAVPKTAVDASVRLAQALARWQTAGAQRDAVQALVRDGGPPAMQVLEALRQIAADWTAQVGNDAKQVDQTLEVLALPGDVTPLLRLLADDRRAQLRRDYAASLRRMRAADVALTRIRVAHNDMAAHLDELGSVPLRARLQDATEQLRTLRASGAWEESR